MRGLIRTEIKSYSTFLSEQEIGGQLGPLPGSFSSNVADQNFEIAILYNIVNKSNDCVFEDELIPQSPWRKSDKLWALPHCLHTVFVIGKYIEFFKGIFSGGGGWGGAYTWRSFHGGFFQGEKKIFKDRGGVPDFPALFQERSEIK